MRRYAVRQYRYEDVVTIWVGDMWVVRQKNIHLKWWVFRSPAERIRVTIEKFQKLADKFNNREMYLNHEVELGKRRC